MGKTIRLTTAQALVKFLSRQMTMIEGKKLPIFAGVWAIFGHGNVAGIGEALFGVRKELPTYRAHNEQAMAHAAIAFAKASRRRRMMACTSSIGPGALNMVTAAAVAHVNRVPVLLLPGDVFANRLPDPVLQQETSSLVSQLRENADRYRLLAVQYPFSYLQTRGLGELRDSTFVMQRVDTSLVQSITRVAYRPGNLVTHDDERARR